MAEFISKVSHALQRVNSFHRMKFRGRQTTSAINRGTGGASHQS
jgi:hypothetical protein